MKRNTFLKIGLVFGFIGAVAISALFISFTLSPVVESGLRVEPKRIPFLVTGDANLGDATGFLSFMVKNHSTDDAEYTTNITNYTGGNANCYEWSDAGNTTCTGETPYSTNFDIVVKVGITNEDGCWTGNQSMNTGYFWCLLTCADLSIGADTNMTEYVIGNSSTYIWVNYVLDNGGAGYSIVEGQSFNVTAVKFYVQRIV